MLLAGVEEERREGKRPVFVPTADKQFLRLNPPLELDLMVVFAAQNSNYETALRDLSDVAAFFQANPVFDQKNFPDLNSAVVDLDKKPWQVIEKLYFYLCNFSFEQQNNLWTMHGGRYIPSVVLKKYIGDAKEDAVKTSLPFPSGATIDATQPPAIYSDVFLTL